MKTKMITISENNNTYGQSKEIYNYSISLNGNPDSIELNLLNMLKDMDKRGFINIKLFIKLFSYEYLTSISNIFYNIKPVIINITDNMEIIKNKMIVSSKEDTIKINEV